MNIAKLSVGTALGAALICGGVLTTTAHASTWHANTPDQIQIVKGQKEYTVKYGDTLWAISIKTNIKVETLAKASGITDPNFIQVGQKIILDGNSMKIENPNGEVIGSAKLNNSDKVNQNQAFGTFVRNVPSNYVNQSSSNNQGTVTYNVSSDTSSNVANSTATSSFASSATSSAAPSSAVSSANSSAESSTASSATSSAESSAASSATSSAESSAASSATSSAESSAASSANSSAESSAASSATSSAESRAAASATS